MKFGDSEMETLIIACDSKTGKLLLSFILFSFSLASLLGIPARFANRAVRFPSVAMKAELMGTIAWAEFMAVG